MNQLVNPSPSNESSSHLPQTEYVDAFHKIYKKINQTNKEAFKSYSNDLLIQSSDIQEIHQKMCQTIKTFRAASVILKINMVQAGGEQHTFNDFDSFGHHNTTSPYATHEVYFEYKFILYQEDINKFENYVVNFKLSSRIAAYEQFSANSPDFLVELMSSVKTTTALINIEYYDYVKARAFLATFDEWVLACNESPSAKNLLILKKYIGNATKAGKLIILALLTYLTARAIPQEITDISYILKFIISYAFIFTLISTASTHLFTFIQKSIDKNIPKSYIKINKGDEKLIKAYDTKTKNNFKNSFIGLGGAVLLGISTNFIYDMVKFLLTRHP